MLLLRTRVDLGVMAIEEYSAFSKVPTLLENYCQIFASYPGYSLGESYPSAEMQSEYSTAPANWASFILKRISYLGYVSSNMLTT